MFNGIKSALSVVAKNVPVGIGLGVGAAIAAGAMGILGNSLNNGKKHIDAKIQARKGNPDQPNKQSAQAA